MSSIDGGSSSAPPAETCDAQSTQYPARQLRLLSRREYRATVRDLLSVSKTPCATDQDCDLATESCTQGSCATDPCDVHTFLFDPGAMTPATVVVAGSFNTWAATASQGGWPMSYDPARHLWAAKRQLANGSYDYKLVLDGAQWLTDPTNPAHDPDGFGGENSVLVVSCAAGQASPALGDPTATFPIENRPQGYFYDDSGPAGLVSDVHVTEYLSAAQSLAAYAVSDVGSLLPCSAQDPGCPAQFVQSFGKRAFRRPLSTNEVAKYVGLIGAQASLGDGLKIAIAAMLSSPSFLYRSEIGALDASGFYRLSGYEVASALSYLFWGTMPDAQLFQAADHGDLDQPAGIEQQARRMLADPRSREIIGLFALQWLGAEDVVDAIKQPAMFPEFDDDVRRAMAEETKQFVEYVVFDSSHRFDELLTAGYTFANDKLAAIYGIDGVRGSTLARVDLSGAPRSGFLTQGSVLATYAHSDQSSPIRRGVFVRERLLCEQLGVPPPNAGMLPPVDPNGTARDRFSQHSAAPGCRGCHALIDPIGFGFEQFDAIGRFRTTDNGHPIDPSGDLTDLEGIGSGTHAPFQTVPELAQIIAGSQAARSCFTKQYVRFARGVLEAPEDRCAIQGIESAFEASGWDVRELIIAVVKSPGFVWRR
jgi:hypothetical protein